MRLDKMLANLKYASRKNIKKLAKDGLITVNGKTIKDVSMHINPAEDTIMIGNEEVVYYASLTLMMNKRKGVVSARHDDLNPTVMEDLDPVYQRHDLHIAGRLDKDTQGLLILTTDGTLLHRIISPHKDVYKYYEVILDAPLDDITPLERVMHIKDGNDEIFETAPGVVEYHEGKHIILGIKEGKFHQVKRMMEAIGRSVVHLRRIRIHCLKLDETLAPGEVRVLSGEEIDALTPGQ